MNTVIKLEHETKNRKLTTEVVKLNGDLRNGSFGKIQHAAELMKKGEIVGFPTETVYGMGTSISTESFWDIFHVKQRVLEKPLQLMVSDYTMVDQAVQFNPTAGRLFEKFLPGPLMIIMKRKLDGTVPNFILECIRKNEKEYPEGARALQRLVGRYEKIGIRYPKNEVAIELIKRVGAPLIATSANMSERGDTTTAFEVMKHLDGKIKTIIDGGETKIKLASTVVDVSDENDVVVFREGSISAEEIKKVLGSTRVWHRHRGMFIQV